MPYDGVDPRGLEIERLRRARGWTRRELGRRTGNDYKTVYGIEKGFQRSTRETLQRFAIELGVALDDVMLANPTPKPQRTANPTPRPQPTSPVPPPRPTKAPTRTTEDEDAA